MFCGHDSEWANPDCKSDRANLLEGASLSTWNVRRGVISCAEHLFNKNNNHFNFFQVQKVTSLEGTFLNNRKVNFDFSNWNVRIILFTHLLIHTLSYYAFEPQTRSLENLNQAFEGAYVVFECGSSRIILSLSL